MNDHNTTAAKLIITFGGLILVLAAAIVVIVEMAPPEGGTLTVGNIASGEAHIGTDETATRIEEELRALPQIRQVEANVLARGRKAEVRLELHVTAEADLAATTEEACRRARELIEGRMAIALARPPQAQLHYRELQLSRPPGDSPAAPSPGSRADGPSGAPEPAREVSWLATGAMPATNPEVSTEAGDEAAERTREDRPAGA
jgi:hypothetical protein